VGDGGEVVVPLIQLWLAFVTNVTVPSSIAWSGWLLSNLHNCSEPSPPCL